MKLPVPDEDGAAIEEEDPNKIIRDELAAAKAAGKEAGEGVGNEAMDMRWNARMKQKLERMKTKRVKDMSITITQKGGTTGALASRQRMTQLSADDRTRTSGQGRIREELTENKGTIEFIMGEMDGEVDICVQSISALKMAPSRLGLFVTVDETESASEDAEEAHKTKDRELEKEKDGEEVAFMDHKSIKQQMSRLERDLKTLNNRVQTILSNADVNKDQEKVFHEQSLAMNRASSYWPLIQLMVLLVTGFTQVNHIVKYMKSRHIG
jgi:hypothetical protein